MTKAQAFTGANFFIDGVGLLGEVVDIELPKIEAETIEGSSGIGKVEVTLPTIKPLSVKVSVNNLNELYFKLLDQSKTQKFYVKANATNSEGEDTQIIATFEGKIKSLSGAKIEFNKEANFDFEANVSFYKLEVKGSTQILYDAKNNIYEVGGFDLFSTIRKNIL
ncbi:phage major tail tube protein [Campylobacter mucosalis]|uniref:Phage major tail tube protein n=1 Tax=Campylobacter mucosalis CCUG 21559 TaxID=1032067 RepID=A0A6G5QFU2_9BACT|nr:phage major tail tube protein [Campylobacter mucosalis]QCD44469.1 phage major tail tube protein [Campylobacter mucosalis CCUG 21559]